MSVVNGVTPKPAPVPKPKRMTLAAISKGKVEAPYRILLHGVDGVGKTTFAAGAPSPIFLGTEDGTDHLDVARFPAPESFDDVLEAVRTLTDEPSEYKTLVLDSLDWAEPLVLQKVCAQAGVQRIEEVGGGYGVGYNAAIDTWRGFLAALEKLQRTRGVHVVLIGHSMIKAFKNPQGEDFDRYILKMHEKSAALVREWCKGVYFANYETFAVKDKAKRVRGVSTGARIVYTQRTAAYDAKDRYSLPESLPLSWDEFHKAAQAHRPADPVALASEIHRKAAQLGAEFEKAAAAAIERAAGDAEKLSQLNDWCNGKLIEREN